MFVVIAFCLHVPVTISRSNEILSHIKEEKLWVVNKLLRTWQCEIMAGSFISILNSSSHKKSNIAVLISAYLSGYDGQFTFADIGQGI